MQIRKKKSLNTYHRVDPSLLWYVNTVGCLRRLILACFICPTAFRQYHNNNDTRYDSCLYQAVGPTNTPSFRLHGVSSCYTVYYHTTGEYEQQHVKVKRKKACKKALENQAALTTI